MVKPDRRFLHRDDKKPYVLDPSEYLYVAEATARVFARSYRKLPLEDLLQEAYLALLIGCQNYDPEKAQGGVPQTYLIQCVRGHLKRVRSTNHRIARFGGYHCTGRLYGTFAPIIHKRWVTPAEVQALFRKLNPPVALSLEESQRAIDWVLGKDLSVDSSNHTKQTPYAREETLLDHIEDEAATEAVMGCVDRKAWEDFCAMLPDFFADERLLTILQQRILADQPLTLLEIGNEWGVSRERVRQLEAVLLRQIHKLADSLGLFDRKAP